MENKQTIFSGIKATGRMHLGNYLGAVKNWVELQNSEEFRTIYSIVDLHTITVDIPTKELRDNVRNLIIDLLAAGIDPQKSLFFIQSHVKEHAELAWMLNCLTPISELEKMTQFKDKAKAHRQNINAGLFTYPTLMAADILLYHATLIPVGEDQEQHVELTCKIARKFNQRWSPDVPYFQEPKTLLTHVPRLMALNDPEKKMSKDLGEKSYIALSDTPEVIAEKISRAVTDSGNAKDKNSKGGRNLLDLFRAFIGDEEIAVKFEEDYKNGALQYSKFKPMLANVIIQGIKPIQQKRRELLQNSDYIEQIIAAGAEQAQAIAQNTMKEVKKMAGLI